MLKHLQKFFSGDVPEADTTVSETPAASQADQLKELQMDVTQNSGATASAEVDVAALQSTVAALTSQLASAHTEIAMLTALVAEAAEFKAAKEKAEAEAKVAARTAKLVDVVGTEAAAGLQAATASLDDTAFDAVVSAMKSSAAKEATAPAFTEQGVEAKADASKVAEQAQTNGVLEYLKSMTPEQLNHAK